MLPPTQTASQLPARTPGISSRGPLCFPRYKTARKDTPAAAEAGFAPPTGVFSALCKALNRQVERAELGDLVKLEHRSGVEGYGDRGGRTGGGGRPLDLVQIRFLIRKAGETQVH